MTFFHVVSTSFIEWAEGDEEINKHGPDKQLSSSTLIKTDWPKATYSATEFLNLMPDTSHRMRNQRIPTIHRRTHKEDEPFDETAIFRNDWLWWCNIVRCPFSWIVAYNYYYCRPVNKKDNKSRIKGDKLERTRRPKRLLFSFRGTATDRSYLNLLDILI